MLVRLALLATPMLVAGCGLTDVRREMPPLPERVTPPAAAPAISSSSREMVVVLHGLARTRWSMAGLGRHLEKQGYEVVLWSYPSLEWSIEKVGQHLLGELAYLNARPDVSRVHLVGHSLGGIVARRALLYGVPAKMGRLVQLASPNRGSPRARQVGAVLGRVVAPLGDLSDRDSSGVNQMAGLELVPIGVIAGSRDFTVPIEYTRLEGAADHIVISSGHTFIMSTDEALRQVTAFLREGRFERSE